MKVLLCSAEMVPYAKVGGLADVTAALARVLLRRGHDVWVALPGYPSVTGEPAPELERLRTREVAVPLGREEIRGRLVWAREASGVGLLLVDQPEFFHRPNPYVDPETGQEWPDAPKRFLFFCRALELALRSGEHQAEVVHLNDNHTAPLASFLARGRGGRPGMLLAIHNVGYQGVYERDVVDLMGLPPSLWEEGGPYAFWGKVNFLKMGIVDADKISTVSPRYAWEIANDPDYGAGLEGVLKAREADLVGILNGIDTEIWNPETDPLIPFNYKASDFQNKRLNKERLLETFELPTDLEAPVIGMVSRLAEQKGFDLIEQVADRLLAEEEVRMVFLGTGEPRYEEFLRELRRRHPERVGVHVGFSEPLAHLIEAGSDFFLMPSRYEPCGLNQMYSMRYGTIPIVRATGGLADTVSEFDPVRGKGTGFVFGPYEAGALLEAIRRALAVYRKPKTFKKLVAQVMQQDFSWDRAAGRYEAVYEAAVRKARGAA
jgi:starch synthase